MSDYVAIPDDDDDLFGETTNTYHKHNFGPEVCRSCEVVHSENVLEQLGVEDDDLEEFMTFLDKVPDSIARSILNGSHASPQMALLSSVLSTLYSFETINVSSPAIRALVEVTDSLTDGAVSAKWRVYESQRRIALTVSLRKLIDDLEEDLTSYKHTSIGLLKTFTHLQGFLDNRIKHLTNVYYRAAEHAGMDVDAAFAESGLYSDIDSIDDMMKAFLNYRMSERLFNVNFEDPAWQTQPA